MTATTEPSSPGVLAAPPGVILVMGVSGSGKSTIATLLAARIGWRFDDADAFHPQANIEKMRAGHPLSEDDRAPWLAAIAAHIGAARARGERIVLACSALKHAHRVVLIGGRADARLVYLAGARDLLMERLAARTGHFMPATLLDSQLATLEPPGADERPVVVSSALAPDVIVATIVAALQLDGAAV